jgi:SAM-dependent methyltransferase
MTSAANFSSWEDAVHWLREQPDQQELVKAAYYDDPLFDAAMRYWRSDEWVAIRRYLPAVTGPALDIGAGRGIASFALAKEGFQVEALEPDGSGLVGAAAVRTLAQLAKLPIRVTQEMYERLPFADGIFAVVFARAVLHHTADLGAACKEFIRVLKPGGRLIAVREHVISSPGDLPAFLEQHPLHKLYGGENAFLLRQYIDAISNAGFVIDSTLAPFDSAINLAPYTDSTIRAALAARVTGQWSTAGKLVQRLLESNAVWKLARPVLNRLDSRPGRLYSFIAHRALR